MNPTLLLENQVPVSVLTKSGHLGQEHFCLASDDVLEDVLIPWRDNSGHCEPYINLLPIN